MTRIATIAAAVSFGPSAAAANPHPNIVYTISDDQGWKDVGCHGSDQDREHRHFGTGGARLKLVELSYGTGHGFAFQISAAYSAMVRSLENFPELATFKIALRAQASRSAYKFAEPADPPRDRI